MELEMTRGCICDSLTVNDVEEYDMTDEQRQETIKEIFNNLSANDLNSLLVWFLKEKGTYDCSDEPCEECGDWIETWKLTI